jgi:hypothetical protein
MTHAQFHEFAATKTKGLPEHVKKFSTGTASATLGGIKPLPKSIYGSDTIPSALTPGEMVLNNNQQKAVMPIPGKEHMLKPSQLARLNAMKNLRMRFRDGGMVPGWEDPGDINFIDNPDTWANIASTTATGAGAPRREAFDAGLDPRMASYMMSVVSSNPWLFGGGSPWQNSPPPGLPGSSQGQTAIPAFFDSQGYPYGEPVMSDYNTSGGSRHIPAKKPS